MHSSAVMFTGPVDAQHICLRASHGFGGTLQWRKPRDQQTIGLRRVESRPGNFARKFVGIIVHKEGVAARGVSTQLSDLIPTGSNRER